MRQEGTLQQRSKVTLHFEVRDTKRRPAQGDFTVAVTDRKAAAPVATAGIYSTLMLSSELRGVIEDPDWYFAPDNAQGDEGLDELLLTQGWRRYDVPKLLRDEYKEPYYPLEAGQEIAGRIERTAMFSKKKKLDRYTMRLLVPRSGYATSAPIAEDGSFALNGFDFPDSTTFVLRPTVRGRTITDARILITPDSFPEYRTLPRLRQPDPTYVAQARRYIEQRGTADMRNIVIDTVVVTAKPWDDDIDENAPEHRLAARSWNAEQIKEVSAGTILDFIEKMPGMQVMGRRVLYRGHKPAFMVDGRLEETVSMLNKTEDVVGESTNWGSGRMDKNDKRTIHYQPIPTVNSWVDMTGRDYSSTNLERELAKAKRQVDYQDNLDNVPDCLYYPIEQVARIDLIDRNQTTYWGNEPQRRHHRYYHEERKSAGRSVCRCTIAGRKRSDAIGLSNPCGVFTLRHTTPKRNIEPTRPTIARRFTGILSSSSMTWGRLPSSSTPPMHRSTTTSLSKAYPEAARLSESSGGSRRHPEIRRTADRPTHAPVRPDIKRHPDIARCPDAFRSDVMSPADGQPPNGRRHLRGRGRYQSTPCSTIDLATFMKPAMLAPFM